MTPAKPKRKTRSRGAVALARVGKTKTQIAAELGVSVVTAHYWLTGRKRPDKARRKLIEQRYGVTPSLWDEYPPQSEAPKSAPSLPGRDPVARLDAMARQLMDQIQVQLDLTDDDRSMTPLEMAGAMKAVTPILTHLARLRGEYDVSKKIFSTSTWRRVEEELAVALEAFPDAARAVAERFRRLQSEDTEPTT